MNCIRTAFAGRPALTAAKRRPKNGASKVDGTLKIFEKIGVGVTSVQKLTSLLEDSYLSVRHFQHTQLKDRKCEYPLLMAQLLRGRAVPVRKETLQVLMQFAVSILGQQANNSDFADERKHVTQFLRVCKSLRVYHCSREVAEQIFVDSCLKSDRLHYKQHLFILEAVAEESFDEERLLQLVRKIIEPCRDLSEFSHTLEVFHRLSRICSQRSRLLSLKIFEAETVCDVILDIFRKLVPFFATMENRPNDSQIACFLNSCRFLPVVGDKWEKELNVLSPFFETKPISGECVAKLLDGAYQLPLFFRDRIAQWLAVGEFDSLDKRVDAYSAAQWLLMIDGLELLPTSKSAVPKNWPRLREKLASIVQVSTSELRQQTVFNLVVHSWHCIVMRRVASDLAKQLDVNSLNPAQILSLQHVKSSQIFEAIAEKLEARIKSFETWRLLACIVVSHNVVRSKSGERHENVFENFFCNKFLYQKEINTKTLIDCISFLQQNGCYTSTTGKALEMRLHDKILGMGVRPSHILRRLKEPNGFGQINSDMRNYGRFEGL